MSEDAKRQAKPGSAVSNVIKDVIRNDSEARRKLIAGSVLLLVERACSIVLPLSTMYLIDDVFGRRLYGMLAPLLISLSLATICQGLCQFAIAQVLIVLGQNYIAKLRQQVQAHALKLPISFHDNNKVGELVSRLMHDVEGVRNLFATGLFQIAGATFTAVLAWSVLLWISPMLGIVSLILIASYGYCLNLWFSRLQPRFNERDRTVANVTGRLMETLSGIRVVKGYQAEEAEAQVFTSGTNQIAGLESRLITMSNVLEGVAVVWVGLSGVLLLYLGGHQVFRGALTLGGLMTCVALLSFLVAPINQFAGAGARISEAAAAVQRTQEILAEVRETENPRRTVAMPRLNGEVSFEHVSFSYVGGNDVLRDISFQTKPGTITALIGPSGAGKSTVIELVAAFHAPTKGRILVDGTDLSTATLESYRSQLGIVLQETFLFDGTIRENVAFARPHAAPEEVRAACEAAMVLEFADGFKDGLDTMIGERGVKLSGGQRQRISIARALLADPRILVLDEATSHLDAKSESLVHLGMRSLMRNRTTFVIAHRVSTIRTADLILVIENGQILEYGTHEDLYARGSRYQQIHVEQSGILPAV